MRSSKNRKIVLGVVCGIVLLCAVGLIGGLLRGDEEPSTRPGKQPSSPAAAARAVPTPDPATRDAYLAALNAIDPEIVHGRPEKAVNRGRDLCTTIQHHPDEQERLVKETRERFTSHRNPGGFGRQKAERILAAVRQYICPTY
ncbi:MAG TPA: hypothetical protein VFX60_09190 [Micromonospora sp.]|nr:hypothetical protein [Micromonospora sp.]